MNKVLSGKSQAEIIKECLDSRKERLEKEGWVKIKVEVSNGTN